MKKYVDGVLVDLIAEEIAEFNQRLADAPTEFDTAMENLRTKRNKLLADTDYLALSDNTLSTDMATYRTSLRDITNNLTTKAEVDAVVFPTKP